MSDGDEESVAGIMYIMGDLKMAGSIRTLTNGRGSGYTGLWDGRMAEWPGQPMATIAVGAMLEKWVWNNQP